MEMPVDEMAEVLPANGSEPIKKKKTRRGNRSKNKGNQINATTSDLGIGNLSITEPTGESSPAVPIVLQDVPNGQVKKNVPQSCGTTKASKKNEVKRQARDCSGSKVPKPESMDSSIAGSSSGVANKSRDKRPKKKKTDQAKETPTAEETASPQTNPNKAIKMSNPVEKKNFNHEKQPFRERLPTAELEEGLKSGKFVKGQIRVSQKSYKNSFVSDPEGHRPDILISELHNRSGALDRDIVVVCLNPETKWMVQTDQILEQAEIDEKFRKSVEQLLGTSRIDDQSEDYEIKEIVKYENGIEVARPQPEKQDKEKKNLPIELVQKLPEWERYVQRTGYVVGIDEKVHNRKAVGYLTKFPAPTDCRYALFKPNDSRIPRIKIPRENCPPDFWNRPEKYKNTIFVAKVTLWNIASFALGELIDCLGNDDDLNVQTTAILKEFDVDDSEFSLEEKSTLPSMPFMIPRKEISSRKDFRRECVFTIDPSTARDLDDALSVTPLQNGNYLVGVHIADVSHFVCEKTPLDRIASQRGTTVYLVQKCVPMLPRELSEDLCSLNPGIDRLTFSVQWELTKAGEICSDVWYGKSIIRSCTQLSYEDAQEFLTKEAHNPEDFPFIEGPWTIADISNKLKILDELAKNIRKRRFDKGLLRIDQPKVCFNINKESGLPSGFFIFQQLDSHRLVEEFMILANVYVAKKIYEAFPELALLRNHPPPSESQMKKKERWLKANGFHNINVSSKKELQASLELYSVSNSKVEADKKSDRIQKSPEIAVKNCKTGVKSKTENSVETLKDSQNPSVKEHKVVKQEATVDALEAVIYEKLTTHKNTIQKEPGIDPQLIKKMKILVVLSSLSMPMKLAEYICSEGKMPEQLSHFALAEDLYTHFTSPIRRYPDVLVHRLLLAAITSTQPSLSSREIGSLCRNCNKKKLLAKRASEKSDELFLACFIANSELVEEVAIVTQIHDNSISCLIRNLCIERKVYFNRLPEVKGVQHRKDKKKRLEVTMNKDSGCDNVTLEVFDVINVILKSKSPTDFEVHFNPHKKVIKNKKPTNKNKKSSQTK